MEQMNKYKEEKEYLSKLATEQQSAASDPYHSVWVEASAGTGKTKVLSDRVLRLLLEKADPAKILCLTYTKAAAVEMNERIAKRLSSWAVDSEENLKKEILSLLGSDIPPKELHNTLNFARTLFAILLDTHGGMKIQTIHSFCQDILKRFPLEAGISPYFDVLDDRSAKEILQNIKLDLLKQSENESTGELAKAIKYLTQSISEFTFPTIMNMITENRNKIEELLTKNNNDLHLITSQLEEKLDVRATLTEDKIKSDALKVANIPELKKAIEALFKSGKEDNKKAEALSAVLASNFSPNTYHLYRSVFLNKDSTVQKRLACADAVKNYPEILNFMQKQVETLLVAENKLTSLQVLRSTTAMLNVAKCIIDKYNAFKEVYATLDYEDLIIITKKLLENSNVADWVLFKLDGGIEHILIDEAQDTSPNQWAIIRALTQEFFAGLGRYENKLERTVFVVGDRKQSIYSFQGADPREFDKMYQYFEKHSQNFAKVHLDVSFRSTKAVMDCVNMLFEAKEAKKGVVPENEHINHRPFRLGEGGKVEIFPLLHPDNNGDEETINWRLPVTRIQKTSASNQLARLIAQNIKTMVESNEILTSKNRPLRYGDFMFLVQRRNSFVEEFVRACKDLGVNVAGVDKLKLLEQIAVQDLISLGKFLLLPNDDLSLAEVLKSPLFMLDDDDLFTLCYQRRSSLFDNILKNPQYADTAEKLKTLLNMAGFCRPFELFNYILVKMNGRKNFISRMGSEVEDVLDEFLNLTISFEQKHTPLLESFISWVEKDEVIIQKEMEQGESNTVKIMTVHGSKGLQAPIVILADTTRIKIQSKKSELLWDTEGNVFFPADSSCYDDMCNEIKEQNKNADEDEYRRLLYVALTRAEDRLYVAGYYTKKEVSRSSWYKLLENNLHSNIPLAENDKRIVYEIKQENDFEEEKTIVSPAPCLPDYSDLLVPAAPEKPLAKPYTPSKIINDETEVAASPLEENGNFYKRGTVIHKLLQFISNIPLSERYEAALKFTQQQLPEFSAYEQKRIINEVIDLCSTYSDLFSVSSVAEVPIIGEADGKIISAKVDRLVVCSNKVMVVDYKTNRPAAKTIEDVPEMYLKQMAIYKKLLQKIYPDKTIETYLLWTNTCNMMKV